MTRIEITEKLSSIMSDLVDEWGITAVTTAFVEKIESNENWRQMDHFKDTVKELVNET